MISSQVCVLASAAFAGALVAYVPAARQNGWPVGRLFAASVVPTVIYLAVMAVLLGAVGTWAYAGRMSWLWLLWVILASLIGAAFVTNIFRSWSGAIALIAAPALTLAALLLRS